MIKLKKELILIIFFMILSVAVWQVWKFFRPSGSVSISTDKNDYKKGENIIVEIENKTNRNVCFSSCYPYYLEKKDGDWESYSYDNCSRIDLTGNCVKPKEKKFFQIEDFSYAKEGFHRLSVPACLGCNLVENFREDKKFYSNEFFIK